VYCEKPLTLFITEGQALVKAVRQHKRILQTGSQHGPTPNSGRPANMFARAVLARSKPSRWGFPGELGKEGLALDFLTRERPRNWITTFGWGCALAPL
jgi:hypothetical protein